MRMKFTRTPGTPGSRVDIAPGDVVVAIDGIAVDERDCDPGLKPEDSESIVLTIRRDGTERDIEVEVVDPIP